jgi:hypothetical protein
LKEKALMSASCAMKRPEAEGRHPPRAQHQALRELMGVVGRGRDEHAQVRLLGDGGAGKGIGAGEGRGGGDEDAPRVGLPAREEGDTRGVMEDRGGVGGLRGERAREAHAPRALFEDRETAGRGARGQKAERSREDGRAGSAPPERFPHHGHLQESIGAGVARRCENATPRTDA